MKKRIKITKKKKITNKVSYFFLSVFSLIEIKIEL
jgi:hypothetical protein